MTLRSCASDSPRETRRLPQLPQEVYDLPDAVARPVTTQPDLYDERLYHSIDDSPPPSQVIHSWVVGVIIMGGDDILFTTYFFYSF